MFELESVFAEEVSPNWSKEKAVTEFDIFMFVESGHVVYEINENRHALTKGDMLFFPKGTLRYAYGDGIHPHQKYAVTFQCPDYPLSIPLVDGRQYRLVHSRSYDYIKQRFSLLTQQWLGKLPHYDTICKGIVYELLGLADRETENAKFPPKKLQLVKEVQQYIIKHYREPIRIELLAQLVDRSPNYVTTIFREVTGQTPIDYLHQVRIASARELILNTHMTIGQIAEQMGFCDQSYFNRVYKKITGYPPSSHLREKKVL
ncbi:MAG: hypothetical protein K0Q59_2384 [Paenibacillus sp.]|nr:hypothetical protein [Paenibacillus sp.]